MKPEIPETIGAARSELANARRDYRQVARRANEFTEENWRREWYIRTARIEVAEFELSLLQHRQKTAAQLRKAKRELTSLKQYKARLLADGNAQKAAGLDAQLASAEAALAEAQVEVDKLLTRHKMWRLERQLENVNHQLQTRKTLDGVDWLREGEVQQLYTRQRVLSREVSDCESWLK